MQDVIMQLGNMRRSSDALSARCSAQQGELGLCQEKLAGSRQQAQRLAGALQAAWVKVSLLGGRVEEQEGVIAQQSHVVAELEAERVQADAQAEEMGGELAAVRGALAATAEEAARAEGEWAAREESLQMEMGARGDEIEVCSVCWLI
jgi:chromosome segregation ATPase